MLNSSDGFVLAHESLAHDLQTIFGNVLFLQVFRNIIVPLVGQKKALMESDAHKLRKQIEKSLPSRSHPEVYEAIAKIFTEAKEATAKPKSQ